MYNTIQEVLDNYEPTAAFQKQLCETWYNAVNQVPQLKALRDFVEENQFGHGERPFYWLFKVIMDELPERFMMVDIGVFRGQTMVMMKMLANIFQKDYDGIVGITPMDSSDNHPDHDYEKDITDLHIKFGCFGVIEIIKGMSTDKEVIEQVKRQCGSIDLLFVDGGHSFETVQSDIINYSPLVKVGGFMLMDDSCCGWDLPQGYFSGISSVTDAVNSLLPPATDNDSFELLFHCGHIRVYRKIK
jgi:hypothetical protein